MSTEEGRTEQAGSAAGTLLMAPQGILGGFQVEQAQMSGTETRQRTPGVAVSVRLGQPVQRSWAMAGRRLASPHGFMFPLGSDVAGICPLIHS